uniref:AN1-type domain-containing protein n=1 Tax=Elaeophora elaphi TaxID=1147741 RepID=A0A0R3S1J1_9BILA
MAEFPGFGRHCNFDGCNLLELTSSDGNLFCLTYWKECHVSSWPVTVGGYITILNFLPIRCDACKKDFCGSHYSYDAHCCQSSYKKDMQVPVCPLCNKPVPVAREENPDRRVSDHIDSNCESNPAIALKGKIYTYHCSQRHCKKRELVPIKCNQCKRNFCLKHRFPADHHCMKVKNERTLSNAALVALRRNEKNLWNESVTKESKINSPLPANSVSEDEALTRALQELLNNSDDCMTLEERDRAIAEEMQRMEYQQQLQEQRVPFCKKTPKHID